MSTREEPTLQQQLDEKTAVDRRRYGTFGGVFTPTLLTILGVIMYLREGWVVGNAGLLGAWLIILLAVGITVATGLSMSTITTNIRIGAGGAFSIISQSLGLEVGGSVGVPLFLSQALAVAMYVFGFREGWLRIFPDHPALLVDLAVFGMLLVIGLISANVAFRVQYVILAVVVASLVSVFASSFTGALKYSPTLWGTYEGVTGGDASGSGFWIVFAVFFPAATGILAGANMSGELATPRRSIPRGTMAAIALSSVIYLALAYWLSRVATPQELTQDYTIMVDRALWGPVVMAGILGATFSSALASFVGAPRVLQALTMHGVVPHGERMSRLASNGEPRNAMLFTGALVLAALLLRDLNTVAPLITMFFLITYGMINVVVFTEQSLRLLSFRPLLKVPRIVPFLGAAGCMFVMFIISPVFGLIAVALVVLLYSMLVRQQLRAPFGDVRSGLFVALAEWAAKRVSDLAPSQERAWKPNLMVAVDRIEDLQGNFYFLRDLTSPQGSIKLVGVSPPEQSGQLSAQLVEMARAFRDEDVFATSTVIAESEFGRGVIAGMQALRGAFFRPNVLFLAGSREYGPERESELQKAIRQASEDGLAVMLYCDHQQARLGRRRSMNVWVRDQGPAWQLSMHLGNLDLALLSAYVLQGNWRGEVNLLTVVSDDEEMPAAHSYLANLVNVARLPEVAVHVGTGGFEPYIAQAPRADLNVFGLTGGADFGFLRRMVELSGSACLFVRDSGSENVLA